MVMNFKNIINRITTSLLDDDFRQAFILILLSFLLSVISAIAAIPHFIDDVEKLMAWVLVFVFVFSTAIFFLTVFERKHHAIYRYLFMAMVVAFFTYLTFDGGPDGFLYFWILLIPSFSFVAFGIVEGFICTVPMFIILVVLYWTPVQALLKYSGNYSTDIRLRMTLVYFVSAILGFVSELLRYLAAKRLKRTNEHYEFVSMHDSLTNVANQNYLVKYLESVSEKKAEITTFGCLFIDVDGFKEVNDHYGHLFGNKVLVQIASVLSSDINAFVCRWGGDEFVVCFANAHEEELLEVAEKYRNDVANYRFEENPDFHITISIGAVVLKNDDSFTLNHVLELADSANRTAKRKGKDNTTFVK